VPPYNERCLCGPSRVTLVVWPRLWVRLTRSLSLGGYLQRVLRGRSGRYESCLCVVIDILCGPSPRDVKRGTPTQQPTIPWSSLLRQRPRQCSTLQLTQQGGGLLCWSASLHISCGTSECDARALFLCFCDASCLSQIVAKETDSRGRTVAEG